MISIAWKKHLFHYMIDQDKYFVFPRKAYSTNKQFVKQVDFLVINKGKKTAAGHFGKAVKGEFIRFIVKFMAKKQGKRNW